MAGAGDNVWLPWHPGLEMWFLQGRVHQQPCQRCGPLPPRCQHIQDSMHCQRMRQPEESQEREVCSAAKSEGQAD